MDWFSFFVGLSLGGVFGVLAMAIVQTGRRGES